MYKYKLYTSGLKVGRKQQYFESENYEKEKNRAKNERS